MHSFCNRLQTKLRVRLLRHQSMLSTILIPMNQRESLLEIYTLTVRKDECTLEGKTYKMSELERYDIGPKSLKSKCDTQKARVYNLLL